MPPRKSVGRTAAATPARSTRASSAIPVDGSATRRATRQGTQQPPTAAQATEKLGPLREVQTAQSYAYGSEEAIKVADRLDPNNRTSKARAAGLIDEAVDQAQGRFQGHADEARDQGEDSPPASRTRRKTSRGPSREPSLEPANPRKDATARIAAWADSLESDQLEEIQEEDEDIESPEDQSRKDTEPSSFPSGIFDHSYNFERGLRRPKMAVEQKASQLDALRQKIRRGAINVRNKMVEALQNLVEWLSRILRAISKSTSEIPDSSAFAIGVKAVVGACCLAAVSFLFCWAYSSYLCDPTSTSIVSQNLQKLCGTCTASYSPLDLSGAQQQDISRVAAAMQQIQKQIQLLESRLNQQFDTRQSAVETEIGMLKQQQIEMSSHLADLHIQQSSLSEDAIASPLLPQVNFFAPSNGAIIDPTRTTPTKGSSSSFPKTFLLRVLQMRQMISKGPLTALEPWHDVGDCWCAASGKQGDLVRLHVTTNELIYPTELVIEHFPAAGTRVPGTIPNELELWADVSATHQTKQKGTDSSMSDEVNALGPGYGRLGTMKYVVRSGINHVQSFRLEANRQGLVLSAKKFVLRVTSSYGADHVCLYRVRLHGVPVNGSDASYERVHVHYQQQGYVVDEQ